MKFSDASKITSFSQITCPEAQLFIIISSNVKCFGRGGTFAVVHKASFFFWNMFGYERICLPSELSDDLMQI